MATPFTVRATRASLLALALVALLWLLLARTAVSAPAFLYQITVDTPLDEYDLSGSGTGCALREAIHTANLGVNFGGCVRIATVIGTGADTIVLPAGAYTLTRTGIGEDFDVTDDLDILRSVIISGTGGAAPVVTSDAGWIYRIFDVLTGSVSMKGLAIQRGFGGRGGAIQVATGASLTLIDSSVTDSHSATDGGGIYNQGTLTLLNASLEHNNSGGFGGGIENYQGVLSLTNVLLSDNGALVGGGIHSQGTAALLNTTIFSNVATTGGGLSNVGAASLISSTVTGNRNYSGTLSSYSGAPCLFTSGTLVLDDVTASDCHADWGNQRGGALYVGVGGSAMLTNTRMLSNSAGTGGAVFSQGTLTISGSYLAHNASIGAGAGLWISGTTRIDASTFYSNTAFGYGGAIYKYDGSLYGAGLSLIENLAAEWGGGMAIHGGTEWVVNATISGNHATGSGGGVYNAGAGLELVDSALSGNAAYSGGGIFNQGSLNVVDSLLSLNRATQESGGGIYNQGTTLLSGTTLSGNLAAQNGGGILNQYAATLTASTLEGNSASFGGGGGLYSDLATADLINTTLSGNTAVWGGGIYNQASQARLLNVTLSNNSASGGGGALFMQSGYTTVLTNTIIAYSPSGGNCSGSVTLSKDSFSSDYTCGLPPGNTIKGQNPNGLDPLLTALGNYGGPTLVHMLRVGSPAIDGVVGSDAPPTDQRFIVRPQGAGYDIGAVEWRPEDLLKLYLPLIRR